MGVPYNALAISPSGTNFGRRSDPGDSDGTGNGIKGSRNCGHPQLSIRDGVLECPRPVRHGIQEEPDLNRMARGVDGDLRRRQSRPDGQLPRDERNPDGHPQPPLAEPPHRHRPARRRGGHDLCL